jgi:hypothetical protein
MKYFQSYHNIIREDRVCDQWGVVADESFYHISSGRPAMELYTVDLSPDRNVSDFESFCLAWNGLCRGPFSKGNIE